jgi:RND superfamily putative drug exporter
MADRDERYRGYGHSGMTARALRVVNGRHTKWLVLVLGLVTVSLVAPLAGKLGPLENNSPTSFLPSGAASTQVLDYQEAHSRAAVTPAVVVYERPGGLTARDRQVIGRARSALAAAHLPGAATPSPVVVSANGKAAFFSVPISSRTAQETIAADVKTIRAVAGRGAAAATGNPAPGALRVAVGGPAGSAADALNAFSGIDSRLLTVTVLIVALLLLLIYRSPVLWLLPLISVIVAAGWSQGFAYALARAGFVINGMTVGILTVLVFGAGTDYALLLVARYREELRRHDDHHEAMAVALRRAGPSIATSALTVIFALLCLLAARLNDIAALGPACAAGIFCVLVAQLVFLPALLTAVGRWAFWPAIPRRGGQVPEKPGLWDRFGRWLLRHHRPAWVGLSVLLGVLCLGLFSYRGGVSQQNGFRGKVGSVQAQQILSANFPAGADAPAIVLVRPAAKAAAAEAAARSTPGVVSVTPAVPIGNARIFDATLAAAPASPSAERTVTVLRQRLSAAAGAQTLVGGETATDVDLNAAAAHDRDLIIPAVLTVVLVMLGLLLRSVVAPVMLVATVLLSYLASLGVSSVVFRDVFGFPGFDPTVPIFGFVFLVALGVDYNIFLMARVREEAAAGAARGVAKGLAVTGTVITSAGVVLAATFAVLAVLPLIALTEVGFLVAFGVLADTILVRSVLVPALAIEIGATLWWPSSLASASRDGMAGSPTAPSPASPGRRTVLRRR